MWLSQIGPESSYWPHVFGPGCIISLSLGLLFTPLASAATAGVHQNEAGLASGVLNTSRQVGGSLGLAVLATIATDRTDALLGVHVSTDVALAAGYARAFTVACVLGLVAFVASFIVPSIRRSAATSSATVAEPQEPDRPGDVRLGGVLGPETAES